MSEIDKFSLDLLFFARFLGVDFQASPSAPLEVGGEQFVGSHL